MLVDKAPNPWFDGNETQNIDSKVVLVQAQGGSVYWGGRLAFCDCFIRVIWMRGGGNIPHGLRKYALRLMLQ